MKSKPIIFILLATILTSAFVWVRLQIVSISYDIHELQVKEKHAREINNNLNLKIHGLRSPFRLEQIAKHKFNMKPPTTEQVIVLQENGK